MQRDLPKLDDEFAKSLGGFENVAALEKSIKDGIELALESLAEEGKEIPIDNIREQTVTTTEVRVPEGARIAFA